MAPHGFQPVGKANFSNRIGNPAGEMLRAGYIDLPPLVTTENIEASKAAPSSAVLREFWSSRSDSCAAPELVKAIIRLRWYLVYRIEQYMGCIQRIRLSRIESRLLIDYEDPSVRALEIFRRSSEHGDVVGATKIGRNDDRIAFTRHAAIPVEQCRSDAIPRSKQRLQLRKLVGSSAMICTNMRGRGSSCRGS